MAGLLPAVGYFSSQHTAGFYEKNGFSIVDILPDGFGKGIDKYTMEVAPKTGN